jgi:hypothetical protein
VSQPRSTSTTDAHAPEQRAPDEHELTPEDAEEIERRAEEIPANRAAGRLLSWEALFPPRTSRPR